MKPDEQAEIIRRLRRTAGHLKAVITMTESGTACEQVLHQLNAARAALQTIWARPDQLRGPPESSRDSEQFVF